MIFDREVPLKAREYWLFAKRYKFRYWSYLLRHVVEEVHGRKPNFFRQHGYHNSGWLTSTAIDDYAQVKQTNLYVRRGLTREESLEEAFELLRKVGCADQLYVVFPHDELRYGVALRHDGWHPRAYEEPVPIATRIDHLEERVEEMRNLRAEVWRLRDQTNYLRNRIAEDEQAINAFIRAWRKTS